MAHSFHVCLLYNAPLLAVDHPDYASEAGVLESVEALTAAIRAAGHRTTELAAGDSAASLARELADLRPDLVINLCEALNGDSAAEPHVAALLELLGLPYTGSPPECLSLTRDKARTKRLLAGAGVATPDFVELPPGHSPPKSSLQHWLAAGPLIVKPAREDASLGIGPDSVVTDWPALERQVACVHERYGAALVERFVAGREFNVGILELGEFQVLPLAEVEFLASAELPWPIVTYDGKWATQSAQCLATPVICPADVEPDLAQRIREAAAAAYRLTGCRHYARIDLRVDDAGKVFVLEVNANPDLGPDEGVAYMLSMVGVTYEEFARGLVETCLAENPRATAAAPRLAASRPAGDRSPGVTLRAFSADDLAQLLEITRLCGVFHPDEIEIAAEVLCDAARQGAGSDYEVIVAEHDGRVVGWSCHGHVPLTDATFDLYWIAVAPDAQEQGIGRELLTEVERRVQAAAGRWLLAETSSTAAYDATRAFYLRCGYRAVSEIDDFYRPADGRIIFGKRLDKPIAVAR